MKRMIPLLLVALLILPAFAVAEGNRLMKLDDGEYLRDLLTDGETLYVVGDNALYTCGPDDAALTPWESDIRLAAIDGEDAPVRGFYDFTLFVADGGLRGIHCHNDEYGAMESLALFDVAFSDHGTVTAEDARVLDVPSDLRALEWFYVERACASGDALYLLGQIESGTLLCVMDVNDPRAGSVEQLPNWDYRLIASPDGVLLADRDYMKERLTLYRVEPDGELDEICALPQEIQALAADPLTGAAFGALDGRAVPVDTATGEVGEAVAVLTAQPRCGAVLAGGRVYAADVGANIALMDTEGQANTGETLTILGLYGNDWIQNAVVDFSVAHPELSPSMRSDFIDRDQLLDAMLTQSPDIDVYMLDCKSTGAYRAMRDRGFMLPLDGSEALASLAERMYPTLRQSLSKDGALVALPISAYGYSMGIDEKLLGKLGLSIEDVPGDWLGFLDFLEDEIKPRLGEMGEKDRFSYDGITAELFGTTLRYSVLENFVNACDAAGELPDYESPDLVAILERLDGMDFTEYGLPDSDNDNGYGWSSDQAYLIQPDLNIELGGESISSVPLILDFGDSLKGVLALNTQVVFVNPYSAHRDAALAFLALLSERLPDDLSYLLCPDLNEPVRWPEADEELRRMEEAVEQLRGNIEAAEPSARQALEEELAAWEENCQRYREQGMWRISAEKLARYRAMGERVTVAVPSWFDEDYKGDAWELLSQYYQGRLSAREFLAAVNRKARMMAMEG